MRKSEDWCPLDDTRNISVAMRLPCLLITTALINLDAEVVQIVPPVSDSASLSDKYEQTLEA